MSESTGQKHCDSSSSHLNTGSTASGSSRKAAPSNGSSTSTAHQPYTVGPDQHSGVTEAGPGQVFVCWGCCRTADRRQDFGEGCREAGFIRLCYEQDYHGNGRAYRPDRWRQVRPKLVCAWKDCDNIFEQSQQNPRKYCSNTCSRKAYHLAQGGKEYWKKQRERRKKQREQVAKAGRKVGN